MEYREHSESPFEGTNPTNKSVSLTKTETLHACCATTTWACSGRYRTLNRARSGRLGRTARSATSRGSCGVEPKRCRPTTVVQLGRGGLSGASTAVIAGVEDALKDEVRRFTEGDPYRSMAVVLLDEPQLRAQVAADVPRPAGSFLKIIPAVALYRAAEQGEFDLDATVKRRELGTTKYPSILEAFDEDRLLSLREVCAFSLITSDNPAAQYILDLVGPERIDRVIAELGLEVTTMRAGFTDQELGSLNRRNITTANEALHILLEIEHTPAFGDLRRVLINYLRNQRIPVRLDDDTPVMHKTGSLETVAVDVGVIYSPYGRIAVAYLCDHQPDTVLTSVAIGDSALRVVEIVGQLHR